MNESEVGKVSFDPDHISAHGGSTQINATSKDQLSKSEQKNGSNSAITEL